MNRIEQYRPEENKFYICLDINGIEFWTKCLNPPLLRGDIIVEIIRQKYTQDDEFALNANMMVSKPTQIHKDEYSEYQKFRDDIKEALAELQSRIDEINTEFEESRKTVEPDELISEDVESVEEKTEE